MTDITKETAMKIITPKRISDSYGEGHYGAPRGDHDHKGTDRLCYPDSRVFAPIEGIVTKLGYAYSDDLSFRYVQITNPKGLNVRVMYIKPTVKLEQKVNLDTIIGISQRLDARYPQTRDKNAIDNHIHFEVFHMFGGKKTYHDPEVYLQ